MSDFTPQPSYFEFSPRDMEYEPVIISEEESEYTDLILGVYNTGETKDLTVLPVAISRLGIARGIATVDPTDTGYQLNFGGIGIISERNGGMIVDPPDMTRTVRDYIAADLPNSYRGMRTTIILPDGQAISSNDPTPLGAYSEENAWRKWKNTLKAHSILNGTGRACIPECIALLRDTKSGAYGIVTKSPKFYYPAEALTAAQKTNGLVSMVSYARAVAQTASALYLLHSQDYVHVQPGGNWGISVDRHLPPVIRDWETLQNISGHNRKAALKSINGQTLGKGEKLTAHGLAKFYDIAHFARSVLSGTRLLETRPDERFFKYYLVLTAAAISQGYNSLDSTSTLSEESIVLAYEILLSRLSQRNITLESISDILLAALAKRL